MPECSEPECTGIARARGLCRRHYRMVRRRECAQAKSNAMLADGHYRDVYYPDDPELLPDDGHVDATAVDVAASGTRIVRLTHTERELAARRILAAGGTVETVCARLNITEWVARQLVIRLARVIAGNHPSPPECGDFQERAA